MAKLIEVDANVVATNVTPININFYKYTPGEEALNLQSMFSKLPQDNINEQLTAVLSFPPNIESTELMPKRMFVYYNGKYELERDGGKEPLNIYISR